MTDKTDKIKYRIRMKSERSERVQAVIKSMTGYGRSEQEAAGRTVLVEIKSVNHKFFECSCRVPRGYSFLEEKLRSYIQGRISRGKVDVAVSVVSQREGDARVVLNHGLAAGYLHALRELAQNYQLRDDLSLSTLAAYSDLFTVTPVPEDEDGVWDAVRQVTEQALSDFLTMRQREGQSMQEDVERRIGNIFAMVERVEARSKETVAEYQKKLEARLREILENVELDDQRLLMEAAIFADKTAVAEETVRLRSHLDQMKLLLRQDGPAGRKLDFLTQEMNREANTIGSKAMDAQIAHIVVEMKAEIEKIREQIQNME